MNERAVASSALRIASIAALVAAGLMAVGCASSEAGGSATARAPVYERSDNQTGSNLPRKANKPSNVLVVDPEAMQGAVRGVTRNSGTGP